MFMEFNSIIPILSRSIASKRCHKIEEKKKKVSQYISTMVLCFSRLYLPKECSQAKDGTCKGHPTVCVLPERVRLERILGSVSRKHFLEDIFLFFDNSCMEWLVLIANYCFIIGSCLFSKLMF